MSSKRTINQVKKRKNEPIAGGSEEEEEKKRCIDLDVQVNQEGTRGELKIRASNA